MPPWKAPVRTQSVLFTVLGDFVYLRDPGAEVWIGGLSGLLGELGFSGQAVRLAVSRMCRKGWLKRVRRGVKSYYSLTAASLRLMQDSERRIFRRSRGQPPWDGTWHLIALLPPMGAGGASPRLRKELTWLGYGPLNPALWVSPHAHQEEVERLVEELGARGQVEAFTAHHLGFSRDKEMAQRCWDLDKVAAFYRSFLAKYGPLLQAMRSGGEAGWREEDCFRQRVELVHEYRKFPFLDPGLPYELLPEDWPGEEAEALFQDFAGLLAKASYRFFDCVTGAATDV